jgi:hypothetical protein
MFVVDQSDQQVLEGRILVAALGRLIQRIVQGLFEFASETRHLDDYSPPPEKPAGFDFNVIRGGAAIKSRLRLFPR